MIIIYKKINANELNNIFANLSTNTTKNLSITNNLKQIFPN